MKIFCKNCNIENDATVLSTKTINAYSPGYPVCPTTVYTVVCDNCKTMDDVASIRELNEIYERIQSQLK